MEGVPSVSETKLVCFGRFQHIQGSVLLSSRQKQKPPLRSFQHMTSCFLLHHPLSDVSFRFFFFFEREHRDTIGMWTLRNVATLEREMEGLVGLDWIQTLNAWR